MDDRPDVHPHDYFTGMYDGDDDPWGFDEAWYERRKFALTVAALPRERYRRGLEPGCANGTLTTLLADRCDELHAFDFVAVAVERARSRLATRENVHVDAGSFPEDWPGGTGDLVVWSEVAYYLGDQAADRAIEGLRGWLDVGGDLIAVHWTGETDYPRSGGEIGPWLDAVPFLQRLTDLHDEGFDLGVWRRTR